MLPRILNLLSLLLLTCSFLYSQNQNWNSVLILNPNPSSFLSDWQTEIRVGTFTLIYNGSQPVEYYSKLKLIHNSLGEILSAKTGIESFLGAGTKTYIGPELVDWKEITYPPVLKERVFRTGRLIEGGYDLEIEIYSRQHQILHTASGSFSITYSDPPQLISPQHQEIITVAQPNFQWSPVIAAAGHSVKYNMKLS